MVAAVFSTTIRETLVSGSALYVGPTAREVLCAIAPKVIFGNTAREILLSTAEPVIVGITIREALVTSPPQDGPIPIFPILPWDFPLKLTPVMKTIIGNNSADREVRVSQQPYALWQVELTFPELRDQTQNDTPYPPLAGHTEYMQLVQSWLMAYGKAGIFAFSAPWDNSRSDVQLGTGDGKTYIYSFYRTWGTGTAALIEPVGAVDELFSITIGGAAVPATNYFIKRNKIYFINEIGVAVPPPMGETIVVSFSFYYLCKFMENTLDCSEFFKNRWEVKSLKFRSVIWQ